MLGQYQVDITTLLRQETRRRPREPPVVEFPFRTMLARQLDSILRGINDQLMTLRQAHKGQLCHHH